MPAPRFFVSFRCAAGAQIALEPDDAHHAAHVLRTQPGDRVVVIDADGPWDAEVTVVAQGRVEARVTSPSAEPDGELPIKITVLQALTKGAKFDDVVEKCVELGVQRIVPVDCARSYAEATEARLERWRRIARAAAQQSRRRVLPTIVESASWAEAVAQVSSPLIVAWEGAPRGSLATALARFGAAPELAIAVGPEGSLTDEELAAARAAGCAFVSLGPTILRTETAAAALLAAIASRVW